MIYFLRNSGPDMAKIVVACVMLSLGMNTPYLGCAAASTYEFSDLMYALRVCHK